MIRENNIHKTDKSDDSSLLIRARFSPPDDGPFMLKHVVKDFLNNFK
jgi:hypothetical protein